MTAGRVLEIALSRKAWIATPVVVTAGLAALLAVALERRVPYRAETVLSVTTGADAGALFALRSLDVMRDAIDASEVLQRRGLTPAVLRERVAVDLLGDGTVRLEVTAPSKEEAELAAFEIVRVAAERVRVTAERLAEPYRKRMRRCRADLDQRRANERATARELSDLLAAHTMKPGPDGNYVSVLRFTLADAKERAAAKRLELADFDAEFAATAASAEAADQEGEGLVGRIATADAEVARRKNEIGLTDAHPRVLARLAERWRLTAELASRAPAPADSARPSPKPRAAAALAGIEERVRELAERVNTDAAAAEATARSLVTRIRNSKAQIGRAEAALSRTTAEAEANRPARAAIEPVSDARPEAHAVEASAPAGGLAAAGAVLGLVIGALLAAFAEALDPAIRSSADVVRRLEVPVLATVSFRPGDGRGRGARWAGALVWLGAFVVVAALMLAAVYPGWSRIRALVSGGGTDAHAVKEYTK